MTNVYFITQGCSANVADSEIMQGLLIKAGYNLVDSFEDCDIIVYNTCTVKGPTDRTFKKAVREIKLKRIPLVVAGCIPQSQSALEELKGVSLVGTFEIDKIADALEETLNGRVATFLNADNKSRLNMPKARKNPFIEIVPISHGCLGHCTYCKTKQARGHLHSYNPNDILRHISKGVDQGAKEIWITSQDNSAYGLDIGTNLAELIKKVLTIDKDFMIRIGMSNPEHILPIMDELIHVYKDDRVYKFLHVPLQSGSNKVLKDMNRNYTVEDYMNIIEQFRKSIPDITLSTDIICAFPTENEDDFKKTINAIKRSKPVVMNISRFWPRPGTSAAKLKLLPGKVMKHRTSQMTRLHQELSGSLNKKWIGWSGEIFVDEKGKNNTWQGRNYAYKAIVINSIHDLLGKKIKVRISDSERFYLHAKLL